jgi:hypothetical protein
MKGCMKKNKKEMPFANILFNIQINNTLMCMNPSAISSIVFWRQQQRSGYYKDEVPQSSCCVVCITVGSSSEMAPNYGTYLERLLLINTAVPFANARLNVY